MRDRNSFVFGSRWLSAALFVVAAGMIGLGISATEAGDKKAKENDGKAKEPRTIGDIAGADGLQSDYCEGFGLIVNLNGTGSDPVPSAGRSELLADMQKRGVTMPEEVLRSPNTALVRVRARVPPAVRSCKSAGCWCKSELKSKRADPDREIRPHKGDTFDVEVEAPDRDTTKSLQGGWLLEAWLYEVASLRGGEKLPGHVRARAEGPVLVAGGVDAETANPADLRRGRVLGGGVAREDRDFFLVTQNDRTARWTTQIGGRINQRFPARTRDGKPVAEPKNGQQVALKIPVRYRENIARYLEVIRYMPLTQSGEEEAERMARWGEQLLSPSTARLSALRLEGIGTRAIDTIKAGLQSSDPDVRFFAAEALAYLGDTASAAPLAETARQIPEYRAHALTALSALDEPISRIELTKLMSDSESVELRYGAFRALREIAPDDSAIAGTNVNDRLYLHQIPSKGTPLVHVSSRNRSEIVIFGNDVKLETPLLLWAGRQILVQGSDRAPLLVMTRFNPGYEKQQISCNLQLGEVIQSAVRGGATYPEIISMLVTADKQHNLPGRLELDSTPDPSLMITRLRRISDNPGKSTDDAAMPNLLGWSDTKKPSRPARSTDKEASASKTSDGSTGEPKYIMKQSWFDRTFRRTAN